MESNSGDSDYAEVESFYAKDPYLFVDILDGMQGDVSWQYSAGNSVFETGESGSEEVIEEHFKELEHSASNYFGEYRIELADDGLIILEKEYNRRMLSDSILVGKGAEDLKFKVIGEVKEEILEDIWERIRR